MRFECFVGNLEYSVTEEILTSTFSEAGRVVDVRLKLEGGRPAGYGFVGFEELDQVKSAISLMDGRNLNGRQMKGWSIIVQDYLLTLNNTWPSLSPQSRTARQAVLR